MPEAIVARIDGLADAERSVVAERYRQRECSTGRVLTFCDGQGGRNDGRPRV